MTRHINAADVAALIAFVGQEDASLFVGSGVSLWSGLPTWPRFIQALIDHAASLGMRVGMAQAAIKDGRLADAADSLGLPPLEIANLMRRRLGFADARPHRIHALLTHLGPERFLTTNYDTLIEQQLGLEGRLGGFRTVTASRVAEMADVVKASANRFVFKPHGDIGDAGTMIVSARDYERVMLGGGNLVRQGLETLLVSRPVLFIGFGLRDPDLNLILRSITDNYLGNIHHFYAIVADLSDEEREYWYERFRIRAFGYPVLRDGKGQEDHSALLDLLDAIVAAKTVPIGLSKRGRISGAARFAAPKLAIASDAAIGPRGQLTRFAASLVRERGTAVLHLRGLLQEQWGRWPDKRVNELHQAPLARILEECPVTLMLVGQAGSGKSHAIREYLSTAGIRLLKWLTSDGGTASPPVPVLLDARLYDGSFEALLAASLPESLDLVALSSTHRIDLIIDSIDEMPQIHLDGGAWRADLACLVERFVQHRLIYGTRRSALVGDPLTAIFHIGDLTQVMVSQHLVAHGLSVGAFAPSLLTDIDTPFELALMTEFGAMIESSRSISSLIAMAINHFIARVPDRFAGPRVVALLRDLAYGAVIAGRETIAIGTILEAIVTDTDLATNGDDARDLLEGLVRSGLIISEVESQVRFVHRSVTEYLCSTRILEMLDSESVTLADLLANRRWDDPLTWSLSSVDATRAGSVLTQVYQFDPLLALRIVTNAERDRDAWWIAFLENLHQAPLEVHDAYSLALLTQNEIIPLEAVPALRTLTIGPESDVRGWVWQHYARYASESEMLAWLDMASVGGVDYNEAQMCGREIGSRLSAAGRRYFRVRLASISEWTEAGERADSADARAARCFSMTLIGFDERQLGHFFRWALKQPQAVITNICLSLYENNSPAANRFLTQLFDRRNFACCVPLEFRGRRWEGEREGYVAPFTPNRFDAILNWLERPEQIQSAVSLLGIYLKHDESWQQGVRDLDARLISRRLRPLRLLLPETKREKHLHFITTVLKAAAQHDVLTKAMIDHLAFEDILLPEELVLDALTRNFTASLTLLEYWLGAWYGGAITVSVEAMDRWIALLVAQAIEPHSDVSTYFSQLISTLSQRWSFAGRARLIARSEALKDPMRDFVLGAFVPALTAFNFAELSRDAGKRLLELYISGRISEFSSLGRAATEEFVEHVVLPRAESCTEFERERIVQFLGEAGDALGRRYRLRV